MRIHRNIKLIFLILVTLFYVAACFDREPHKSVRKNLDLEVDPALQKINGMVAVLDLMVRLNKKTNCALADSFNGFSKDGDKKSNQLSNNPILEEIVGEQNGLCELFKLADSETRTTFNDIKIKNRLLKKQYLFSIFESKNNDNSEYFTEEEVGLFSSFETCEKVARKYSIPTRKCRVWKDINDLIKSTINK